MWKVARKEQGKIYDYSMEGFLYLLNGGYDFKFHFTNPLIWKKKIKRLHKEKRKKDEVHKNIRKATSIIEIF